MKNKDSHGHKDMAETANLDKGPRQALAERYADGELTIHELRHAGHQRMIELMSDLAELGRRPPLAEFTGPNIETRRAGIELLSAVLGP